MTEQVTDAEQAATLPVGTWVEDAAGGVWCLFQTHVMFHQLMWKQAHRAAFVNLEGIDYPAYVGDLEEQDGYVCTHGTVQECGQCMRCGVLVGDPDTWRGMTFGAIGLEIRTDGE